MSTTSAKSAGLDLVLQPETSPHCSHGPTLLFEKFDPASKTTRQFYACAAFRDRKACPFFQWSDSEPSHSEKESAPQEHTSHRRARKRYHRFRKLPQEKRDVCCSCGCLLLKGELPQHKDQGHQIRSRVGLKRLKKPSFLFAPLDNNKTFAQYLFSESAVDFIVNTARQLNYTHILCVGTPRIHEAVQACVKEGLKSILLDLDDRYAQLYPPSKFAKYNMFNHHFFEAGGQSATSEFLSEGQGRTLLITDPPFGGMVEALASSFTHLSKMWETTLGKQDADIPPVVHCADSQPRLPLPTMWLFPYFMENRILSEFPEMAMLDYKVDYDNHTMYKNNLKQKGSPVRIFTNLPQALFSLPTSEGYWFCEKCQRFSSKENVHCKECGSCTSKDGTTYTHCDMCIRCVKPSRVHCFKCEQCQIQGHICGEVKGQGCHICGEQGHKRRFCPQNQKSQKLNSEPRAMSVAKRKMTTSQDGPQKKRRK